MMRTLRIFIGVPLIAFAHVAAQGQMVIVNSTIPDNDANGLVSTLAVSTAATPIQSVTVTLNISSATADTAWNGDLYAYLTHDDGSSSGFTVLLNRVGRTSLDAAGYGDTGFAITLSDTAANDVHLYQNVSSSFDGSGRLTGTWQPDARSISPTSSGSTFDSASRTADLGSFSGLNANGLWVLFISDRAAGNEARLDSWELNITPVPEPATSVVVTALCLLAGVIVRSLRNASGTRLASPLPPKGFKNYPRRRQGSASMRINCFALIILSYWRVLTLPGLSAAELFQDAFEESSLNSFWSLQNPPETLGGVIGFSSEQKFRGERSLKLSNSKRPPNADDRPSFGIYHVFEDARPSSVEVFLYDDATKSGRPVLLLSERSPWSGDPGRWVAVYPLPAWYYGNPDRMFFTGSESHLADVYVNNYLTPNMGWNRLKVIIHHDYREVQINGETTYLSNFGFNVGCVALYVLDLFDLLHCDSDECVSWYFDDFSWEPALLEGIHVSHAQNEANPTKTINWAEVERSGKTFAYVKASQWDHWPDGEQPDHDFTDRNVLDARGIVSVGVYHVAGNPMAIPPVIGDAVAEAEYFCSRASAYIGRPPSWPGGYLPPVLRLEADFGLSQRQLSDWVRKWIQTVECQTGIRPFIYTVLKVIERLDPELLGTNRRVSVTQQSWLWIGGDAGMMITDPACVNNTCIPTWMFHQYSDSGTCPGISGPVPLVRFNGDYRSLRNLAFQAGEEVEAPSFYGYGFKAMSNQTTRIPLAKVLARARDPKSLPMELRSILSISDEWGDISIQGEDIVYTPPSGFVGTDRFSLSLQNCRGGTSVAEVFVTVVANESGSGGNGSNLSSITAGSDGIRLTFYGIPNQTYALQRSGNLTTWTTVATITATQTGKIAYTDHAPLSAGYYRTSATP